MLLAGLLLQIPLILLACPLDCDLVDCPPLDCASQGKLNDCDCCESCLRNVGEECGGTDGICGEGLRCDERGVCTEDPVPFPCDSVQCDLSVPVCPEDSLLTIISPSHTECCPKAECVCDTLKCDNNKVECPEGMDNIVLRKGTNQPGMCCDFVQCKRSTLTCSNVRCPAVHETSFSDECPEDSFKPAPYIPEDSCCHVYPECRCKSSICPPVRCDNNETAVITRSGGKLPGRCCDEFHCEAIEYRSGNECVFEGSVFNSGDEWALEPCQICSCNDGVLLCKQLTCPFIPSHCNWIEVPEGECCPLCRGCQEDSGQRYLSNVSWLRDDCTNCTCSVNMEIQCQKQLCEGDCENSICDDYLETTSEPLLPVECPFMEDCLLNCRFGLERLENGCFECSCASNDLYHTKQNCDGNANCSLSCLNGYVLDLNGCPTCICEKCAKQDHCQKQCVYGFQTDSIGCVLCECQGVPIEDHVSALLHSHQPKSCKHNNTHGYMHGEQWTTSCRHMVCLDGKVYGSAVTCDRRPEACPLSSWTVKKGNCCPSCLTDTIIHLDSYPASMVSCRSEGSFWQEGDVWMVDSCVKCTCRLGHVLCSIDDCQPSECHGEGCFEEELHSSSVSICDYNENKAIGQFWNDGDCRTCTCLHNNTVNCVDWVCPEYECDGQLVFIKGRCCPICYKITQKRVSCDYKSIKYAAFEVFHNGPCQNCTCTQNGTVDCNKTVCESCDHPVFVPFQCCPICHESTIYSMETSSTATISNFSLSTALCLLVLIIFLLLCFVYGITKDICITHLKFNKVQGRENPKWDSTKVNLLTDQTNSLTELWQLNKSANSYSPVPSEII